MDWLDGERRPRLKNKQEETFKISLYKLQEKKRGVKITAFDIKNLLADKFDCCDLISGHLRSFRSP